MTKIYFLSVFLFLAGTLFAQKEGTFKGQVFDQKTEDPLETANIYNKTAFTGTITNRTGYFELHAQVGDTLLISYLGFKNYEIIVHPGDFDKIHMIYMIEQPISLQEVVLTTYKLTGILKADLRLNPVREKQKINLHLQEIFGDTTSNWLTRRNDDFRKILDPVGTIYNWFSAHGKDMRKLKKLKEDNELTKILSQRFDRKTISDLLDITEEQVYRVLELCQYSKEFLQTASDLQILEALRTCYEKHKLLFENMED